MGFSPDGKTFIVTEEGRPAALYSAETGEVLRRYELDEALSDAAAGDADREGQTGEKPLRVKPA